MTWCFGCSMITVHIVAKIRVIDTDSLYTDVKSN